MLDHRPLQSQRLHGLHKEPQIIQESLGPEEDQKAHIVLHSEDGSAKNLLEHVSQDEGGVPKPILKSDHQGQLSRGEFAHIRRNLNLRKQRVLTRGLFYLFIVVLLFLTLGLCVVGFFYATTILAVGSIVGFFFGSLFEIFAVRPLYLLIIAAIRQLINKKKKKRKEKPKDKQNPLENAELMDEANYLASEKEKKKKVGKGEGNPDQEQAQLLPPDSPPAQSEKNQEQPRSFQEKQIGEEQLLNHTESPVQTRRSGVNPPDSPFGTNQSGIPKRDTALFDRQEPSFDRAANLLVTPKVSSDRKKITELNHQKIAQAQTGRRSDGKSGSPLASPTALPQKAKSTQVLHPLTLPEKPKLTAEKSLVQKAEMAGSVSGNRSEDGVIQFDVETAQGEEAQVDGVLPIYFSGRKDSGVPSKLDKIPDDGEVRREDIPEEADIDEMMMNPLDDLCPYKKMITDIIYLSCGPEGGDQLMKRITKENDDIPLEDLQRIVEQNDYEVMKKEEGEEDEERVDVKPEVRPVIPIEETPQEQEEDTNSVPPSDRKNESLEEKGVFEVEEAKGEETKPPQEEQLEKKDGQDPKQGDDEADTNALILAQSPRHFEVPQSLRKAQEDSVKSEEKKYLSQSRKSVASGIRGSTLSPASQAGRTGTRSPGALSRKSPTGASIRSNKSGRISEKSPPMPHLSPRKVLMGAGLAPNTKGRPRGGKDRSLELDLGNMSGSVVISGDRGGQTPPGIQGAEPFFLISQEGPRGGYQKRGGKGKKKKKSRKDLVEYDNGERQDSLQIDGTSVFFKQGQELPVRSESEDSFSEGDMVYYNKEDLTNYSRHLGLNKLKGPTHRFKKVKKMRHSFHPDLSSLSSEEEARRINRSLMHSSSGRPLTYSQMLRRHHYSPQDMEGSRRVDCWNREYEMLLRMGKTPTRRVSRLSASRKLSNEISPLRVPVQRNSSFNRGVREFYSLQPSQQRRGYLPPMSRPKKKKKKKNPQSRAQSHVRSSASEASRMWIPQQMQTADRMNNLSVFRRPSHMETLSTALRPGNNLSRASRMSHISRGSRQYSDEDELSPYAERMIARFKSWYPGKEQKLKRRKPSTYAKVGMLESLYGGPVEITGIGICGGIRPSQRRKWVKHHKALQIQRSHIEEDHADDFHPQPLIFGKRQISHRSSRSSVAFPEPPEASFNPNFYKYYESDSSGEPPSNRFKFHPNKSHNSSFSPQQQRRQKHSVDTLPSISKKPKRQQFEPLFNPDSTDQKWVGEAHERPHFQSPTEPPALSSSESAQKSSLPPIKSPGSHNSNSIQEI